MLKSNFVNTEYRENQQIRLEKVTSLAIYNNGNCIIKVCGKEIFPKQKEVLVVADGTYSDIFLDVEFIEIPSQNFNPKTHIKTLILLYKKIS